MDVPVTQGGLDFPATGCFVCVKPCPVPPYVKHDEIMKHHGSAIAVQLPTGEHFYLNSDAVKILRRSFAKDNKTLSKSNPNERQIFLIQLIDKLYRLLLEYKFLVSAKKIGGEALYYDPLNQLTKTSIKIDDFLEQTIGKRGKWRKRTNKWSYIAPIKNGKLQLIDVIEIIDKLGICKDTNTKTNTNTTSQTSTERGADDTVLYNMVSMKIRYSRDSATDRCNLNEYIEILDKDYDGIGNYNHNYKYDSDLNASGEYLKTNEENSLLYQNIIISQVEAQQEDINTNNINNTVNTMDKNTTKHTCTHDNVAYANYNDANDILPEIKIDDKKIVSKPTSPNPFASSMPDDFKQVIRKRLIFIRDMCCMNQDSYNGTCMRDYFFAHWDGSTQSDCLLLSVVSADDIDININTNIAKEKKTNVSNMNSNNYCDYSRCRDLKYEYIGQKKSDLSHTMSEKSGIYYYIPDCDDMLCWGNHETKKMSQIVETNVACLQGLSGVCGIIGEYCGGGNLVNFQILMDNFDKQIENYQYDKTFGDWKQQQEIVDCALQ